MKDRGNGTPVGYKPWQRGRDGILRPNNLDSDRDRRGSGGHKNEGQRAAGTMQGGRARRLQGRNRVEEQEKEAGKDGRTKWKQENGGGSSRGRRLKSRIIYARDGEVK